MLERTTFWAPLAFAKERLPKPKLLCARPLSWKRDFALAYSNLGRCLLQKQPPDTVGALEAFRAAVHYKPDYSALHVELAELLHQTQQDKEAIEEIRQALQLNPDDERAKQLRDKLETKRKDNK